MEVHRYDPKMTYEETQMNGTEHEHMIEEDIESEPKSTDIYAMIQDCLDLLTPWSSPHGVTDGEGDGDGDEDATGIEEVRCCDDPMNHFLDEGRSICRECGLDIGVYLECNNSCKIMDKNHNNIERVGAPINPQLPDSSMGTSIRWSRNTDMLKIRKFQQWNVMPSKERSLYHVYNMISTFCSKEDFTIPKKVQTTAKCIYQIISEHYSTRGAKRKGLIAACVYYACKIEDCPRDPAVIADMFDIRNKDISNGIRTFQAVTSGIDHPIFANNETSTTPKDYIGRFCTTLGIDDIQVVNLAEAICEKIHTLELCEFYIPTTVAAGVLTYILATLPSPPSLKRVSDLLDISTGTLSRCSKEIQEHEEEILPEKILVAFRRARNRSD
jgi:transcription initiation factor TFIIB